MSEHASKSHRKMTMAELAKLAEVDVSTVSRALNDSPLVKEKTKRLILDIAAETGYAVNCGLTDEDKVVIGFPRCRYISEVDFPITENLQCVWWKRLPKHNED